MDITQVPKSGQTASGQSYSNLQVHPTTVYYRYDSQGNVMKDSNGKPLEYSTFLRFTDGSSVKPSGTSYAVTYTDQGGEQHQTDEIGFTQKFFPNQAIDKSKLPSGQSFTTEGGRALPSQNISKETNQLSPLNQLYQNDYNRIAAQYPNDPQRALEVFKEANPGAPKDFVPQTNTANLPDSANKVLDAVTEHLVNGTINPDLKIDQGTVDSYLAEIKATSDPYFKQLFDQSQQDLQTGLGQIGQDLATGERKLATDYRATLASTQSNLASRGLTNSSIRNTQEKTLADTTQAAIEAGRQLAQRKALELGTNAERKLGSTNLGDLSPYNVNNAPTPQTGQPGVLGFNPGAGTRSLYTPTGNTLGTIQQDQTESNRVMLNQALGDQTKYRSLNVQ